ncbi:Macrophage mannose receptor 1 [Oryzias melastigma]|uniref:Macrophage mannose receptor 1 n=1 Tax=Oryzias melastigma TaxID=30732 RepID=A0A834CCS1_ORYME|nr:Macrophage mannose receptor 1 [Oryzias melastigma]
MHPCVGVSLSAVSSRPARQYHVILDPMNWIEAQRYCREKFTDLASVDNTDDVNILMNMGLPTTLTPWIGLYYDGGTWQWSMTDKDFFKPDGANYRNWTPGEPSSDWNNVQCVYMTANGQWNDASCEGAKKPMCSDVRGSNVTFVHIDTFMTWPEAQKYCREHYTDLASVRGSAENQKIMDLKPAEEDVWIGLSKTSWTWSNGSTTTFYYWNDGEPNDQTAVCAMMLFRKLGKWVDATCEQLKPFICHEAFCGVSLSERKYYFIYETMSWSDALAFCQRRYNGLLSPNSPENMVIVNNMVDLPRMKTSTNSSVAWIGLYNYWRQWIWSLSKTNYYQKDESTFRNWAPGKPDNLMEKVQCCEMYDTGEWNDVSCGFSREPICADVTGSSATFVHINISMTWTEAQSYCRGHHTDLASVRNMEENQKIMGIKPPGGQVWLGLRTGTWAWSSASTAVYRNWAEREPNDSGDCVVANFDNTGKWEDWNCNDSRAFICYHDVVISRLPKLVVKLSVQKSVSLDLDDLVVLNSMLQQLTQKLMERPANGKVKLSWRTRSDGKIFHKRT